MQLGSKRPLNDINVTPLIDVVLVLLIIFMVLTPLGEKQMYLRVPEFEPPEQIIPPSAIPPDQTVLTVLRNGRVLLNRQEMSIQEAMDRLRPAYEGRLSKVLFFNRRGRRHLRAGRPGAGRGPQGRRLNRGEAPGATLFVMRQPANASLYADPSIQIEPFDRDLNETFPGSLLLLPTRANTDLTNHPEADVIYQVGKGGAVFCVVKRIP